MSDTTILIADPFGPANTDTSPWTGLGTAQLQAALAQAQTALINLVTGAQPLVVSYGEGQGQKSVTYTSANEASLRNAIRELQILLGTAPRRRAIRPVF
jgi:hypothetical protein